MMAGIYIHIPFCKQACTYCNFHFSTSLKIKDSLLSAIIKEIEIRRDEMDDEELGSVYFGGGTPSLLTISELDQIWKAINTHLIVSPSAEVTLEANPDDLTRARISDYNNSFINRLSIGVQSFHNRDLEFMGRAHNADQAQECISNALQMSELDLSVDLIYGVPTLSVDAWQTNLRRVSEFAIPHLAAYQLTVEPRTILADHIRKGKTPAPDERETVEQFNLLTSWAAEHKYEHYEVSNLALPGHRAVHNSGYWEAMKYMGIGPAAHSFDGKTRSWNVANNARYIKMMHDGRATDGSEYLTEDDRYNEIVMTSLRLSDGLNISTLNDMSARYAEHFTECIEPYVVTGEVVVKEGTYCIRTASRVFSDRIASDCFMV